MAGKLPACRTNPRERSSGSLTSRQRHRSTTQYDAFLRSVMGHISAVAKPGIHLGIWRIGFTFLPARNRRSSLLGRNERDMCYRKLVLLTVLASAGLLAGCSTNS